MTVHIRPASHEDAADLYRDWLAFREHNAGKDPRIILTPVSEREFAAALAVTLERGTSAFFVAHADGRLVGFVSGGVETNQPDRLPERHVTVGYLYVDPSVRRQGIGGLLVGALATWAREQEGVSHLEMPVLTADSDAAAFWARLGFTPFITRLWMALGDGSSG